jgi:ComF family protein
LADELLALAAEELGVPLLIPIPMHPDRYKERGHNQTEVLCEAALRALGQGESPFEYKRDVLKRVVDTPHQQGLARSKRLKNVEDSMVAKDVEGRVCVVVDDVTTTGATLTEAKRALLAAGARRVHCVALARS